MKGNSRSIIKMMCSNAVIAALYYIFTLVLSDFAFGYSNGVISIRIAEIFMALCIFDLRYAPGLVIGCLLSNLFPIFSTANVIDVLVGPIQTLITALALYFIKPKQLSILVGSAICGIIIGLELYILGLSGIGLWIMLTIFAGELIMLEVGYIIFNKIQKILKKLQKI